MHTCTVKYSTCCPKPQWCPSKPVLLLLTCLNHHMSKHTITAPMMSKMARNRSALHDVLAQGASNRDTTVLYSQEWVNVIFFIYDHQKLYRAFRFGTLWPISCSYPRHSQLTRHSLMLANGRIRQSLTAFVFNFALNFFSGNLYSPWMWNRHVFV